MGKICVPDERGHTEAASWEAGNPDQLAIAQQTFERLKHEGRAAFAVSASGQAVGVMDRFDPAVDEIIFYSPFAGG